MDTQTVDVFGAGGHATVVIQALRAMEHQVPGCCDDRAPLGADVLGAPVLGTIRDLPEDYAGCGIVAVGNNEVRRDIVARFPQATWATVIHPTAVVDPTAEIDEGAVVLAGAIVQARDDGGL